MHKVTVSRTGKFDGRPFFLSCTCGTQGDFSSLVEAGKYALTHRKNCRLGFEIHPADELKEQWMREVGELN